MRLRRLSVFLRLSRVCVMADRPSATSCVTVRVVRVQGSAPRDVGTAMQVFADGQSGTIGGGALEWEAAALARQMLAGEISRTYLPLWIWGAGHVGRAIADVMAPFEDREITVVDTSAARMPVLPEGVTPLVAADPVRVVTHAPAQADHLILTYSHEIDLALCDALLRQPFGSIGLIGSATKWARFRRRLQAMGHRPAQIARIACPIGDPSLGKHPQAIALGVATAMVAPENRVKEGCAG